MCLDVEPQVYLVLHVSDLKLNGSAFCVNARFLFIFMLLMVKVQIINLFILIFKKKLDRNAHLHDDLMEAYKTIMFANKTGNPGHL